MKDQVLRRSCIVTPDAVIADWRPTGIDDLTEADLEPLFAAQPQLVLLGTGTTQRFPPVSIRGAFAKRGHCHRDDGSRRGVPHVQHPGAGRAARLRGAAVRGGGRSDLGRVARAGCSGTSNRQKAQGEKASTNQSFEADRLEQLRVFSCSCQQIFLLFSRLPSALCPLPVAPSAGLSSFADMVLTSHFRTQALKSSRSFAALFFVRKTLWSEFARRNTPV